MFAFSIHSTASSPHSRHNFLPALPGAATVIDDSTTIIPHQAHLVSV